MSPVSNPTIVPGIVSGPSRRYELPHGPATIGRDPANSIVLRHPQVSRFHASVTRAADGWHLADLQSSNGTFLNDAPLSEPRLLNAGDMVRISDFLFVYSEGVLELFSEEGNARLDAIDLVRTVAPGQNILQHVSLSILPRELVAVVGTSGAGKSTLVNALSGFRPADHGVVLLNGLDFYRNLARLRESLGYVPQDDIIHQELPVYRALYYAACLRLPEDTGRREMAARIDQVLADLQLTERRHLSIHRLSGGQRKRTSIGVELLTRPRLFFLDEPTSGLDPGLETEMMKIFRHLANLGHTIIVITHATTNLHICDQVLFMARGGYLAYYGPPKQALKHFNASDFPDIYARCDALPPSEWERRYRDSPEYQKYVVSRLHEIPRMLLPAEAAEAIERRRPAAPATVAVEPAGSGRFAAWRQKLHEWVVELRQSEAQPTQRRTSQLRQFFILTARYGEIVVRDTRNLVLMLLQAPLIAWLLRTVFDKDVFSVLAGNYLAGRTLLFLMVCCCIWFGTSNAAREITKEATIYRRERSANLKIAPYVFSKVAVLFVLCVVQSVAMLWIVGGRITYPDLGTIMLEKFFLVLLLASLGGLAMGLLLSALVSNPDKAGSLVPIVLIPQIVLAGALIPLQGMAQTLSYVTVSKWTYEMVGQCMRLAELPRPRLGGNEIDPSLLFDISFPGHCFVLLAGIGILLLATCAALRLKDIDAA
jgi:ABC-type multidrug transport system ATPase subunit